MLKATLDGAVARLELAWTSAHPGYQSAVRGFLPRVACMMAVALTVTSGSQVVAAPRACVLAGPAPDARVVAFELKQPMELSLRLTGEAPAIAGTEGWHLAAGFAIFARRDLDRPRAVRLMRVGAAPPVVSAQQAGSPKAEQTLPAPVVPFRQDAGTSIPVLPAGRYVAVAFGVDGGAGAPFAHWRAELQGTRPLTCTPAGLAQPLEVDMRGLSGTGASTPMAGVALEQSAHVDIEHGHAFGLLAAHATGGAADAALSAGGSVVAQVHQDIGAVVTRRGRHRLDAAWAGLFPRFAFAGVGYDVVDIPVGAS